MIKISTSSYLVNLINNYISNTPANVDLTYDWCKIFYLANIHNVAQMIYPLIENSEIPTEIIEKFQQVYLKSIVRYTNEQVATNQIQSLFEQNKIKHIFFKGTVLREFYPDPPLRVMGDIDLLINENDRKKVTDILTTNGYKLTVDYGDVWTFEKVGNFNIQVEIHTNLVYQNKIRENIINSFKNPMNFGVFEDGYTGKFTNEFHLFYLFVHLGKHFYDGGTGIRMIADIAVFLNGFYDKIDFNLFYEYIDNVSLRNFADNIFALCNFWFNSNSPSDKPADTEFLKQLSLNIVNHGVFGQFNSNQAVNLSKRKNMKKNKISMIFELFFPSYKTMTNSMVYMKFLRQKPYLTPYAWVYRWVYCLKNKGKKSLKLVSEIADTNLENKVQGEIEFLNKLGI